MLIIIIAWLYVVILMALAEHSVIAGIMTFLLYGLLPLSITVYLLDSPRRGARRRAQQAHDARQQAAGSSDLQRGTDGLEEPPETDAPRIAALPDTAGADDAPDPLGAAGTGTAAVGGISATETADQPANQISPAMRPQAPWSRR